MPKSVVLRRSLIMVSALRPEDFDRAAGSGADMVCADLEDGTLPSRRTEARATVFGVFAHTARPGLQRLLRINSLRTEDGLRDILAVIDTETPPGGIIMPKVSDPEEVRIVAGLLRPHHPHIDLIALIESPEGLRKVDAIAKAGPELKALFFGSADYSAEAGCDRSWDSLAYARARIVNAAKEAGIDAIDGAWFDPHDDKGFLEETRKVVAMGFTGKVSYELAHVPHIHAALAPTRKQIDEARRVVAAAEDDTVGITRLDGRMVNESIVRSARKVLAAAGDMAQD
jgi:citrate lyase beta subunit